MGQSTTKTETEGTGGQMPIPNTALLAKIHVLKDNAWKRWLEAPAHSDESKYWYTRWEAFKHVVGLMS